jgi:iron complex transport system substrate-binding protein
MAAFAFISTISAAIRVASLDLCADEYLLMLARDEQVAAISRLSQDRFESPLWKRARRFPAYGGRAESLVPLRPTILLSVGGPGGKSTQAFARQLGWRSLVLPTPQTPADVARNVQAVADLLGDDRPAHRWLVAFDGLRKKKATAPLNTLFLSGGGWSLDPESLGARWMRMAGLRQLPVSGGRVTLERLAVRPPPVLLLSDYRSGQMSLGARWLAHPLVRAAQSKKIHTDGRPWTCAGPLMLGEIERLRAQR